MDVLKKLLAAIRKADFDFGLINKGDKIMVGISGGKDSIALSYLLSIYQKFADKDFTFTAVMLDLGFPSVDIRPLEEFFSDLNIPFIISDAREVYPILKQHMHNGILPCSICSRMKKAAINKEANSLGFKKVSFAHHADDAIETLYMNMIHGGRIATFSPKMRLERADIDFIRPLIYAREDDIKSLVAKYNLPVIKSTCMNDHESERAAIKTLLSNIYKEYPDSYQNYLTMMTNKERFDLWFDKKSFNDGNGYRFIEAETIDDYIDCMNIRIKVFVEEYKFSYEAEIVYDEEKKAKSILLKHFDKAIGTIRYIEKEDNIYLLQRFAILKEYRSKGLGTMLLSYVEKILSRRKAPITLMACSRLDSLNFYLKLGYEVVENDLIKDGQRHALIKKYIKNAIMDKSK